MSLRKKHSRSPNELDPTDVFGKPVASSLSAAPGSFELALETVPVRKVASFAVRFEDKLVLDSLQAWWLYKHRVRLTQWELASLVIHEALSHPGGHFSSFDAAS